LRTVTSHDPVSTAAGALPSYRLSLTAATITCALAPAYTVRWHIGPLPTTLLEAAILITAAIFVIESIRQHAALEWRTSFTVPAALFLIAGALAVVTAPDRRAALGLYRAYLVEPMMFFVVVISIVRSLRRAYAVLCGLAVAGLAVGIPNAYVVVQALARHTLDLSGTPPVVIYQTANAEALFLLPLIAIAASLALFAPQPRARILSAVFLLIATPAFLLTFSRGGFVALGAVLLGLALAHPRRVWLVAAVALAAVGFSLIPIIRKRIGHELNFSDPSNTLVGRFPLWHAALELLRARPIFGAGLSGFATRIAPYWNATHADRFTYPHNFVLNAWVSTGILGLIAYLWLLVQAFRVSGAGWRSRIAGWDALHLGVFLAFIGIVVHGLVDVPYWKNDLSLEFWVLLGLTWAGTVYGRRATTIVSALP
jgi:putative inorganic carbon (hco3(-)) transporter